VAGVDLYDHVGELVHYARHDICGLHEGIERGLPVNALFHRELA
jgi:hypothetical protein